MPIFDWTISIGSILTLLGGIGVIILYFLDTRYGKQKSCAEEITALRAELREAIEMMQTLGERVARMEGRLNGTYYPTYFQNPN